MRIWSVTCEYFKQYRNISSVPLEDILFLNEKESQKLLYKFGKEEIKFSYCSYTFPIDT